MLNIWPVGSEEGGTLVGCGFSVDETAVYTSQCSDSAVVDVYYIGPVAQHIMIWVR